MKLIYLLIFYCVGTFIYDEFGVYEHTNWSIFANSIYDLFFIGFLTLNRQRKFKYLCYGLVVVFFIEWVLLLRCIGMEFIEYENVTAYNCYFNYFGLLLILTYFLYDYGLHNKDISKRHR